MGGVQKSKEGGIIALFAALRLLRSRLRLVTFDMLGFSFAAKCLAVVTIHHSGARDMQGNSASTSPAGEKSGGGGRSPFF